MLFTIIMSLIYFECRFESNDPTRRISARYDTIFVIYKTVLVIIFTFFDRDGYTEMLIAI